MFESSVPSLNPVVEPIPARKKNVLTASQLLWISPPLNRTKRSPIKIRLQIAHTGRLTLISGSHFENGS